MCAMSVYVAIDAAHFPDNMFRAYISGIRFDRDSDGVLSDAEIASITEISVRYEDITSLP